MSALGAAFSELASTGIEATAIANGSPVSVSTTTVGGVPVTSVSVGSLLSGSSGTIIAVALLLVAGIVAYYFLRRKG